MPTLSEAIPRAVVQFGTEILGGVLLTRTGVVVDTAENPEPYDDALTEVYKRLDGVHEVDTLAILRAVYATAHKKVPYIGTFSYPELLQKMAAKRGVARLTQDHRVGLSEFVGAGGICQENSLFQATLLRLIQDRGDLIGTVHVESTKPDEVHPDRHIRVQYQAPEDTYVSDIVIGGVRADSWSAHEAMALIPVFIP